MPLPPLIEVVPFSSEQLDAFKERKAEIVIPGSKSITNRAIVLAALGSGVVTLKGALWSEDTEAMTECMHRLGIDITVTADPDVDANRTITVSGCGGKIPKGGTAEEPLELFVQNAGTAARFLTAMVCLGGALRAWRARLTCPTLLAPLMRAPPNPARCLPARRASRRRRGSSSAPCAARLAAQRASSRSTRCSPSSMGRWAGTPRA